MKSDSGKASLRSSEMESNGFAALAVGSKSVGCSEAPCRDEPAGSGLLAAWTTHAVAFSKDDAVADTVASFRCICRISVVLRKSDHPARSRRETLSLGALPEGVGGTL